MCVCCGFLLHMYYLFTQKNRGYRSLQMKKDRRKRYHINKSLRKGAESLGIKKMKQRWHERETRYIALGIEEQEERERKEEEERIHLREAHSAKVNLRITEVNNNEAEYYAQKSNIEGDSDTAPLLLDAVLTPVSEQNSCNCSTGGLVLSAKCREVINAARHERDQALMLARQYRNDADACRSEKREMKCELERGFWRDQIVEGGSRSGRILRTALVRK